MNIKKLLPQKKTIIPLLYIIVIIFIIILIKNNFDKSMEIKKTEKKINEIKRTNTIVNLEEKDTDGDGLKDWEEYLYKTNIEIVDTDNDGVSDFDEVNANRDPLVFGKGSKENILDTIETRKNLIDIEGQKRNIELYKKEISEKEAKRFLSYYNGQKKKDNQVNIQDKVEKLKKEENKIIKNDLNDMADTIISLKSELTYKEVSHLRKLFDLLVNKNTKEGLTAEDKKSYKKIIGIYNNMGGNLKSLKVQNKEIEILKNDLGKSYLNLGETLSLLLKNVNTGNDNLIILKKYGEAIKLLGVTSQKINFLIQTYEIEFDNYDSGRVFAFSI